MKLSNAVYDKLKWIVTILLPAIGALYAGLAVTWGEDTFPNSTEVVGSIALIATFLGGLIGLSTRAHNRELEDV